MTLQSYVHQTIAWAKQRLDETDAILSEVEKSAASIKEDARKQAELLCKLLNLAEPLSSDC